MESLGEQFVIMHLSLGYIDYLDTNISSFIGYNLPNPEDEVDDPKVGLYNTTSAEFYLTVVLCSTITNNKDRIIPITFDNCEFIINKIAVVILIRSSELGISWQRLLNEFFLTQIHIPKEDNGKVSRLEAIICDVIRYYVKQSIYVQGSLNKQVQEDIKPEII